MTFVPQRCNNFCLYIALPATSWFTQVYENLPNKYGIDYANVIVYFPRNFRYKSLIWMTTPRKHSSTDVPPNRQWSVHMNNLTAAGMHFQDVKIYTDTGDIDVDVSPVVFPFI